MKYVNAGTVTTKMLYDGADCVADYNENDTLLRYYITPMLDENMIINVAANGSPNADYYYTHDGLGTVRQILDADQNLQNTYDFEAFGTSQSSTENITNRFKFTGRELDPETSSANSTALYYYRARTYDSEIGSFTGRDMFPFNNLYIYGSNSPVNFIDPYGNRPQSTSDTKVIQALKDAGKHVEADQYKTAVKNAGSHQIIDKVNGAWQPVGQNIGAKYAKLYLEIYSEIRGLGFEPEEAAKLASNTAQRKFDDDFEGYLDITYMKDWVVVVNSIIKSLLNKKTSCCISKFTLESHGGPGELGPNGKRIEIPSRKTKRNPKALAKMEKLNEQALNELRRLKKYMCDECIIEFRACNAGNDWDFLGDFSKRGEKLGKMLSKSTGCKIRLAKGTCWTNGDGGYVATASGWLIITPLKDKKGNVIGYKREVEGCGLNGHLRKFFEDIKGNDYTEDKGNIGEGGLCKGKIKNQK